MDYEKNKEALAIVKQMVADGQISQEVAEKYFPELIESEDEKIRKEIIDFATKANNGVTSILANNYNFNKWIAWLEKRAEQKTVVIIPKFRVGDVIRPKGSTAEYTIESIFGECYHGKGWGLHLSNDDDYELVEQKPTEWSEDDQSNFCELSSFIFETYRAEDASRLITWFKSLKERVQPDKWWIPIKESFYTNNVVLAQKKDKSDVWKGYTVVADHTLDPLVFERYINIENISTQSLWKPSDEQIKAVKLARSFVVDDFDEHPALSEILIELEEQLKKLKEE